MTALRLGLTGGIGSGKSTVSHWLAGRGAVILDADAVSRSLTGKDGAALALIEKVFGSAALNADGAMNRNFMRQLVYSDSSARQRLESILHPLVQQTLHDQWRAVPQNVSCVVFDVPLLVENYAQWRPQIDLLLVVDCPRKIQIQRTAARSHLKNTEVEQIMHAQASRAQRLAVADWVLDNSGSLALLEKRLNTLAPRLGL